jgi:hypothetical protein
LERRKWTTITATILLGWFFMRAEDKASQGSVFSFKTAFTLEASLLCIHRANAGSGELCGLWAWQIPNCYTDPLVCAPRGGKHPSLWVFPKCIREWHRQTEHWDLHCVCVGGGS